MTIIEEISKFKNMNEKFSYSILTYSYTNEELIDLLKKKLENINKKIKDSFKKKFINERVFSLITNLESSFNMNEIVNGIFFVNTDINKIIFSKENVKYCNKWGLQKLWLDYDDKFSIEYLTQLFSEKSLEIVFKFSKSDYTVLEIDSVKSRTIESHSSMDEDSIKNYISKFKPSVLYGNNQILKKFNELDGFLINMKNLTIEELVEVIEIKNIKENQELFKKEFLDNLTNPSQLDKLLFGRNEVVEAINNYMVKKLFINPKLYNILLEKLDNSVLNFEILIVKPNEPGDYGQILNRDYSGIVAIKYY